MKMTSHMGFPEGSRDGVRKGFCCGLRYSVAGIVMAAILSGCAGAPEKVEVPFGSGAESNGIRMSTRLTGEGEFEVTLISSRTDEQVMDVRVSYPKIGYDYGDGGSLNENEFVAKFEIENARGKLRPGDQKTSLIRLTNMHEVNQRFDFTLRVKLSSDGGDTDFRVSIEDRNLFSDIEYLRQLNKTDYWHPRFIEENREEYLEHVEEM